jgi:hypothetical protein
MVAVSIFKLGKYIGKPNKFSVIKHGLDQKLQNPFIYVFIGFSRRNVETQARVLGVSRLCHVAMPCGRIQELNADAPPAHVQHRAYLQRFGMAL